MRVEKRRVELNRKESTRRLEGKSRTEQRISSHLSYLHQYLNTTRHTYEFLSLGSSVFNLSLFSSLLICYHLNSSHLISSHLIYSHLFYSHFISFLLNSSLLLSFLVSGKVSDDYYPLKFLRRTYKNICTDPWLSLVRSDVDKSASNYMKSI